MFRRQILRQIVFAGVCAFTLVTVLSCQARAETPFPEGTDGQKKLDWIYENFDEICPGSPRVHVKLNSLTPFQQKQLSTTGRLLIVVTTRFSCPPPVKAAAKKAK